MTSNHYSSSTFSSSRPKFSTGTGISTQTTSAPNKESSWNMTNRYGPSSMMTKNKNNENHNHNNNNNKEALVDKLQGALHTIRRERDDLHRRKELAYERRRLLMEEKENLAKTVHGMKEKLEKMNTSLKETQQGLPSLEEAVLKLTKEVRIECESLK